MQSRNAIEALSTLIEDAKLEERVLETQPKSIVKEKKFQGLLHLPIIKLEKPIVESMLLLNSKVGNR